MISCEYDLNSKLNSKSTFINIYILYIIY